MGQRTEVERMDVVTRDRVSGRSQAEFAGSEGVAIETLRRWVALVGGPKVVSTGPLVPVFVKPPAPEAVSGPPPSAPRPP